VASDQVDAIWAPGWRDNYRNFIETALAPASRPPG
jgi:hypothetical protein